MQLWLGLFYILYSIYSTLYSESNRKPINVQSNQFLHAQKFTHTYIMEKYRFIYIE